MVKLYLQIFIHMLDHTGVVARLIRPKQMPRIFGLLELSVDNYSVFGSYVKAYGGPKNDDRAVHTDKKHVKTMVKKFHMINELLSDW